MYMFQTGSGMSRRSRAGDEDRSGLHCPESDPHPWREKLPKCECLGPGKPRKSISVGVRVTFGVVRS